MTTTNPSRRSLTTTSCIRVSTSRRSPAVELLRRGSEAELTTPHNNGDSVGRRYASPLIAKPLAEESPVDTLEPAEGHAWQTILRQPR